MERAELIGMILSADEGAETLLYRHNEKDDVFWLIRSLIADPSFTYLEKFKIYNEEGRQNTWKYIAWSDENGMDYSGFPQEFCSLLPNAPWHSKFQTYPNKGEWVYSSQGFSAIPKMPVNHYAKYVGEGRFVTLDGCTIKPSIAEIETFKIEGKGFAGGVC